MPHEDLPPKENDFYQELRERIRTWERDKGPHHKWFEYVILTPDLFHLLVKLTLDSDVPVRYKALLAFGVAYFMSPVDLIPDFIPVAGFLDDIAVAAFVLNTLLNNINPEIVRRHWAGEDDILEIVRRVIQAADDMIGKGMYRRIERLIKSKL